MKVLEPGHFIQRPRLTPAIDPTSQGNLFPSPELSPRSLVLPELTQCFYFEPGRKDPRGTALATSGVAAYLAAGGDDALIRTARAQLAEIELVQPLGVFVDSP